MPASPRAASPRLLAAFGVVAALALVAVAAFGFGDVRGTAELRVTREAEATARALHAGWARALESDEPPAAETLMDIRATYWEDAPTFCAPRASDVSEADASEAQLHLLAARAAGRDGRLEDAVTQAQEAARMDEARSGEALLAIVHAHMSCDAGEALGGSYEHYASDVPYDAAVEGLSGRIVALVAAGPHLPREVVDRELERATAALYRNEVALPRPRDAAGCHADRFEPILDRGWTALAELAEERAPSDRWRDFLCEELRTTHRIAIHVRDMLGPRLGSEWALYPSVSDHWFMARELPDGRIRFVSADGDAIDRAIEAMQPEGSGFRVAAFGRVPSTVSLSKPLELEGVTAMLRLTHPDRASLVDPILRRTRLLRTGLVVLAALMLLTSFAGARALKRNADLASLRTTFVASVSHDLRTPIASIGILAENMAAGYARGNEERYVESIQRESARMTRLVDDLLDFGRLERGLPPRLRAEDTDLNAWLDRFETRERSRCREAECAFSVERAHLPDAARVDVAALERALSNLVDNALRHGKASEIVLRAEGATDGTLRFEVVDDGRGIARNALRKDLFEPFRRHGDGAGTGLGLSIVRAIARAHGGDAGIAPREGAQGVVARLTAAPIAEDAA